MKSPTASSSSTLSPAARILTLRSDSQPDQLRDQLIHSLRSTTTTTATTNGSASSSSSTGYEWTRSIPTQYLYSDKGLSIYSEIINRCKTYYPFAAELEILRTYGDEIACRMLGLPADYLLQQEQEGDEQHEDEQMEQNGSNGHDGVRGQQRISEKWGDAKVGIHNHGVNGSTNGDNIKTAVAVELGSGSLDKTRHLLKSLSKILKVGQRASSNAAFSSIDYEALDLEHASLVESLTALVERESDSVKTEHDSSSRVHVGGLHGLYDDGLAHLNATTNPNRAVSVMWLGSSIGNLSRTEAVEFLKRIELGQGNTMLIGIDNCDEESQIVEAYNDPEGVTRRFILEGIDQAGKALGSDQKDGLQSQNFDYVNRYNKGLGRHEAYVRVNRDGVSIPIMGEDNVDLSKGELLRIEVSYKYTQQEALALFHASGFRLVQRWSDTAQRHSIYLIERPPVHFLSNHPSLSSLGANERPENPYGLPSLTEWKSIWKAWDLLTTEMIPRQLLMTKPIPLRHVPLFYIGHLPCFTAIHLSRYFDEKLVEPAAFADIFERGIDPDVDEPTKITHWHSHCPQEDDKWPALSEILAYQSKVRQRVEKIYLDVSEGALKMNRRLSRVLFMVMEHEIMHMETMFYICLQADGLNVPSGFQVPDFASLARGWEREVKAEGNARDEVISFDTMDVEIGHDDIEEEDLVLAYDESHELGWDIENPKRRVQVPAFKLSAMPITNRQYLAYLIGGNLMDEKYFPSSWSRKSGKILLEEEEILVKTLYGRIPIQYAFEWPVTGSGLQLGEYAKAKGGRLPTLEEITVFHSQNPVDSPTNNIGLTNLHPLPSNLPSKQRDGSISGATDGGVWLWTSSTFKAHPNYRPGKLYPGYSDDFFDGHHYHIKGASFVTPNRVARKSFVNWYQEKYPYVIAGARVAFDA